MTFLLADDNGPDFVRLVSGDTPYPWEMPQVPGSITPRRVRGTDEAVREAVAAITGAHAPVTVDLGSGTALRPVEIYCGFRGVDVAGTVAGLEVCFHSRRLEVRPAGSTAEALRDGSGLAFMQFRYEALATKIDAEARRIDPQGARFYRSEHRVTDRGFIAAVRRDLAGGAVPLHADATQLSDSTTRTILQLIHPDGRPAGELHINRYRPFNITQIHSLLNLNGTVTEEQAAAMSNAFASWLEGRSAGRRSVSAVLTL